MSDLFDLHGGGVAIEDRSAAAIFDGLRKLVVDRETLQVRAREAAEYWKSVHCPENLIAHLTGQEPRPRFDIVKGGKAAVLFPWGEAVSGKTGAALRLKYFVRYMETVFDEVRILFTGGGEPGGIIGERSIAEPYHYTADAKLMHEQLKAVCQTAHAPEEDCFHLWYHLWPEIDPVFANRCEEMVRWADHIFVDYTYFVPLVDKFCREYGKSYAVTLFDIVADQAAGTTFLHHATLALELDAARMAPRVICASEPDRLTLKANGIDAELIPHPIDPQEGRSPFSDEEARAILQDLYGVPAGKRRLCFFVGSFYPPNIEAAEAVAAMAARCQNYPHLRDVFFVVAGGCMKPARTENFAALGMIEEAGLSACMSVAEIVLVPMLRGTGVSLKSVEALARGSLILSTSVGMRGLDVKDGVHCRIEDDVSRFPDRIGEMLADAKTSRKMRDEARHYGEKFDFRRLMALYVPGAAAAELTETEEEFAKRRQQAIKELLPRIRGCRGVSATLADWEKPYGNVSTERDLLASGSPFAELHAVPSWTRADTVSDDFDPAWYLSTYRDVAMLGMEPAEHYSWIGRVLGRAPNASRYKKKLVDRRH
jgi:glycosyltransferase involved in cell wall biosynthesis